MGNLLQAIGFRGERFQGACMELGSGIDPETDVYSSTISIQLLDSVCIYIILDIIKFKNEIKRILWDNVKDYLTFINFTTAILSLSVHTGQVLPSWNIKGRICLAHPQ